MDTFNFTPIMVIGAVLSTIFAAGALWNSLSRRKIEARSETSKHKEEKIVFKPMPSSAPARDSAAGGASADRTPAQPLFRQIRPTGAVETETDRDDDDAYVWE